ncbi:hypothetical protein CPQ89_00045 [Ligilactobacillus murinus]|uniref:Uncharacterized protein n=1 Tax=Ligilactobacillus murinus TaxID=1622 RepID=A0AAD0L1F2_9LACO|nr:hypothetical protein [Ligilactobacillus murinus]AWZ37470.1 hypothetical protein CPS94_00240 [Ligilactobacillus murinus]AWZ39531.1 hypothetical protein CPQ89_00045 [Ligilactobacillus murinus]
MIKKAYRKIMFQYVTRLNYDKFENSIMLAINSLLSFLFICLNYLKIASVIPYQSKIMYFYLITFFLLVAVRLVWKWYHSRKWAGIVEVVSTYVNTIIVVLILADLAEISIEQLIIYIVIVAIFYAVYLGLSVWYEIQGETADLFSKKIVTVITSIGVISGILGEITDTEFFWNVVTLLLAMLSSIKIVNYWLILDTPYRRNLIKEFGPKDIDRSAIFISKKKSK